MYWLFLLKKGEKRRKLGGRKTLKFAKKLYAQALETYKAEMPKNYGNRRDGIEMLYYELELAHESGDGLKTIEKKQVSVEASFFCYPEKKTLNFEDISKHISVCVLKPIVFYINNKIFVFYLGKIVLLILCKNENERSMLYNRLLINKEGVFLGKLADGLKKRMNNLAKKNCGISYKKIHSKKTKY
jgi:hypothetical protein